eukprot:scaffold111797_cov61-Phaeocystis_antarctica.AAC.1
MVGEVVGACGASLGGPCGAAKAHCCVAVDESRSSLAARCVSFYQIVCLSCVFRETTQTGCPWSWPRVSLSISIYLSTPYWEGRLLRVNDHTSRDPRSP